VSPAQAKLIEIAVEVTEVNDQKAHQLGIQWLNSITVQEGSIPGIFSIGSIQRLTPLVADLNFLVSKGAAELLANPKLITDVGSPATFKAGGEIPYITSGSLATTNVEFKAYGVTLQILPQVTPEGDIRANITAGVSTIDTTTGATVSGTSIPGLLEREVSSLVTVKPGTTITLAGMVQKQKQKTIQGIPVLSWIPVLGRLFSWEQLKDIKTTLIIFVTPRIIEEGV
jgi:pilus assembly protein CpaC